MGKRKCMSAQLFNDSLRNYPNVEIPSATIEIINARRFSFALIKPYLAIFSAVILTFGVWFGFHDLNANARIVFIVFGLALIGWTLTKFDETFIALAAAIVIGVAGVVEPKKLFTSIFDSTIWLLLASFFIAAAIKSSGLSDRLTKSVISKVSTVNNLFYGLTVILLATAFVIPATSGRAALMLPVYAALSAAIDNRRINIALSLLFPAIILLSAIASLTGAGAHLVTAEILLRTSGEKITFAYWMLLGLPFAIVSCLATTFVILRLFLTATQRNEPINIDDKILSNEKEVSSKLSFRERFALVVAIALVALWMTESVHGINSTFVAILGALIVILPKIGIIKFGEGFGQVNWNILIFMAATLELSEALIESGGAKWIVENSFNAMQNLFAGNAFAIVFIAAVISLLSHLVINSRTARSTVLIPIIVLLAIALGLNPTLLAFISTAAAGFCLTLTVSAKPVMMFSRHDGDTFSQTDLFRLSAVLVPIHLFLLIVFAMFVYPLFGLDLTTAIPVSDSLQNR